MQQLRDDEPPQRHYLSTSRAARELAVSRWTVVRMIEDGELDGIRIRGMLRVDAASVTRYIATHAADGKLEARKLREAEDDNEGES